MPKRFAQKFAKSPAVMQNIRRVGLDIVAYKAEFAADFRDINLGWLSELSFPVEPIDLEVLNQPEQHILDGGGHILMALLDGRAVGTGALKQTSAGRFELTKMGVRPEARGHRVGEQLLQALATLARDLGAQELYLLSSQKCVAAVRLYEKFGFQHDPDVMSRHGGNYGRCDIAMSYPIRSSG